MRSPTPRQWTGIALTAVVLPALTATAWPLLTLLRDLLPEDLPLWRVLLGAGLLAALAVALTLILSGTRRRRTPGHRTSDQGERREAARLFTAGFDTASAKLDSEHAAVRLAGVHTLARLADDAPEGREDLVQMVIDVLCAYLRMPHHPRPAPPPGGATDDQVAEYRVREQEFVAFREVHRTVIRLIGDHLREETRWRGRDYDFTHVVFDGYGDLSKAHFTGGRVRFDGARFTDGMADFSGAHFTGGTVDFVGTHFTGGRVDFLGARFTGGAVNFVEARFTGGDVVFGLAGFGGGVVNFVRARFADGVVSFRGARLTGGMVIFRDARGPCPEGLAEVHSHAVPGVLLVPDAWDHALGRKDQPR
ncbi:pentapeptide repeat-containing protein [Nocardiopsis halotolerans]|uniref:pentapeptide repeat-containing protein n=1 Tax=Nocardiopsis halotolerans TaxID=124252 RepID=UPI000A05A488|nr:pentapeptide repeat-containing protein [Nocardiopsis halotolerans]